MTRANKAKTEEPEAKQQMNLPRSQAWTPQNDEVHPRRDAGSPPPSVPPVILPQGVDDVHPRRGV